MKKMTRYWFAPAGLALLLILAACGSSGETGGGESDTETLEFGTDAAYAPFESLDQGEIVGFDVDLLAAVMEEAGIDYNLEDVGWEPMLNNVSSGAIDGGISAVSITDERKETYDYSNPYFQVSQVIVVPSDSDVASAEDLEELNVGVQNGTTGDSAAQEILGADSDAISKYDTTPSALLAMTNGDVDAVVADSAVAYEYQENNADADVKIIEDEENFVPEYYGIIFPKDSDHVEAINEALQTVMENGTYEEIYSEYFADTPDVEALENAQP